uniref:Uncharacterized protein n=1 Tax=Rheinheimera sp. BAL341 TaxID=1708203 RepID=A0A486XN37_9GAMM
MAKPTSTRISVADLEFVIEYLLVLSQSKRALQNDIPLYSSKNRIKLYEAAIRIEQALLEERDEDFVAAIDHVCTDVEGIITTTIPVEDVQKLKTAIRQKRYKNNDYRRLYMEYQSTLDFMARRSQ